MNNGVAFAGINGLEITYKQACSFEIVNSAINPSAAVHKEHFPRSNARRD
jgi:hypothetical protein